MTHINRTLERIESAFNVAETTPFLCIYSGILRTIVGKIEQIAGTILAIVGGIGSWIAPNSSTDWGKVCELGISYIIHGALNILRGFGSVILAINTFGGLGNIFLLIPNLQQDPPFSPPFTYDMSLSEILTS